MGYGDAMRATALEREEQRVKRAIEKQQEEGVDAQGNDLKQLEAPDETPRRKRWDVVEPERPDAMMKEITSGRGGEWDDASTASKDVVVKKKRSRWDETPVGPTSSTAPGETPKRSRWDQTPVGGPVATPMAMQQFGMTPVGGMGMIQMGGPVIDARNRYLSDEELNTLLPTEGYEVIEPPAGYAPIRTPARKLMETPMAAGAGGFMMQEDGSSGAMAQMSEELPTDIEGVGDLAFFKKEDAQYFAKVRLPSSFLLPSVAADGSLFARRFSATRTRAVSPSKSSRSERLCAFSSRSRTARLRCARRLFASSPTRHASSAPAPSSTRSSLFSWSALSRTRSAISSSRSSIAFSTSSTTSFAPTSTRSSSSSSRCSLTKTTTHECELWFYLGW